MTAGPDERQRCAAFAAARELCRREGGDFFPPSFFLPRDKRRAVYAAWAFARLVQQALPPEGGVGAHCGCGADGLAPVLKDRVDRVYRGDVDELPLPQFRDASQWTMAAIHAAVGRFEIPRRLWDDLIDGLVALRGMQRIATWRTLDAHLGATGGNVGKIVAAVLGATHSDAAEFAAAVGRGAALAGILRRLKPELSRGRLLLPLEDLARFRYSEREMLAGYVNDNFRALVRHEVERARSLLRQGAAGTCWLAGDGSRMAAATFVSLQHAALDEIHRTPEGLLVRTPAPRRPSLASQLRALPPAWRIARERPPATAGAADRAAKRQVPAATLPGTR